MALDLAARPQDPTGPQFSIITKALAGSTDADGRRRFRATASSTITDRAGDEISLKALQQMATKFREGVTIFTDHRNEVANAFGRTDTAEIVQRGADAKGVAIWDLDIGGVVNEPNARMVELHDSIAGGYVQLGCSIDAIVLDHKPNKVGGLSIDGLDVYATSIVGVPMNQRSWTQKAVRAIKGFHHEEDEAVTDATTDEASVTEAGPEVVLAVKAADAAEPTDAAPVVEKEIEPEVTTEVPVGDESGQDAAPVAADDAGGQESDAETPETAPDAEDDPAADPPVEKALAFETADVVELAQRAGSMAKALTERDATITDLTAEIDRLKTEATEAEAVIEKMLRLPLRPRAVGVVSDFSERVPEFLAPAVKAFLRTAGDNR